MKNACKKGVECGKVSQKIDWFFLFFVAETFCYLTFVCLFVCLFVYCCFFLLFTYRTSVRLYRNAENGVLQKCCVSILGGKPKN